ncbi:DUF4349 domain-containing protein [Ruania suaedae]|uniref:DUF4349 domain-containing protein n=1 Tax=Ruania suaedae TaxID=2897774 RepID=UPI001E5969C4|nr:DUF4349 domain-containing protein [Ruania suaedae]UFU02749.1 DUF4349 domain-containing protein [Ruania suaedae]
MRRIQGVIAAAALAMLAACSSGMSTSDSAGPGSDQPEMADGGGSMADAPGRDTGTTVEQRQVITTAHATVVVDDPEQGASDVAGLATAVGGYVENRSVYRGEPDARDQPSADLTVRVPSDDLEGVLADLAELGELRDVSQSSDDVTATLVDLDARISALETSTARLEEIMATAETSSDLLEAEAALSERQAELESLLSQREQLADLVAMSTLHVQLTSAPAPEVSADGFLGGLQTGWRSLVSFVDTVVVTFGVLLPWLVLLTIPVAAIVVAHKRRRGREQTPPAGPPAAEVSEPVS